jgi:hypothetical protein
MGASMVLRKACSFSSIPDPVFVNIQVETSKLAMYIRHSRHHLRHLLVPGALDSCLPYESESSWQQTAVESFQLMTSRRSAPQTPLSLKSGEEWTEWQQNHRATTGADAGFGGDADSFDGDFDDGFDSGSDAGGSSDDSGGGEGN